MEKTILTFSIIAATGILLSSCGGNVTKESSTTNDPSSNEVTIGSQVWMTKNLDVATFSNGDPIPQAKTSEEWENAGHDKQPAWCYYYNDSANGAKYGKLYNWYAVNDSRGLAPVGYHVPSHAEWTELVDFLRTDSVYFLGGDAGKKMKSTSGWKNFYDEDDNDGTNSSGFSGLPGGLRLYNGQFLNVGGYGYWWSSTEYNTHDAWNRGLSYWNEDVHRSTYDMGRGLSVRCLRD